MSQLTRKCLTMNSGCAHLDRDSPERHATARIPLAAHIKSVLDERPGHRAPAVRFLSELEDYLSDSAAEHTLSAVTQWGRYAELFTYDDAAEAFSLDMPEAEAS